MALSGRILRNIKLVEVEAAVVSCPLTLALRQNGAKLRVLLQQEPLDLERWRKNQQHYVFWYMYLSVEARSYV